MYSEPRRKGVIELNLDVFRCTVSDTDKCCAYHALCNRIVWLIFISELSRVDFAVV